MTAVQRYRQERLFTQFQWRVRSLRKDRHAHRLLDESDIDDAVHADDLASQHGSGGVGAGAGSQVAQDAEVADEDHEVALGLLGDAADGSSSLREEVLFVRSDSRAADAVDANGVRVPIAHWFEVVPKSRVLNVLQKFWHPAGSMWLSASKLYSVAAREFVGISQQSCNVFIAKQESAQLSKTNAVAEQMLAPSMPTSVNERWLHDITFWDGTLPSGNFVGFAAVIDALSRFAITKALLDKSAASVAGFLEECMFTYGAPRILQADSAAENKSASVRLVAERFAVTTLVYSKPHASQEQGLVERSFRTLKEALRRAVLEVQSAQQPVDIVDLLRQATKSYNITPHSGLGNLSPWDVFFGRAPPRITGAVLLSTEGRDGGRSQSQGNAGQHGSRTQRDGTSISRSSVGRRIAAEVRDLAASQFGSVASGSIRTRRPSATFADFAVQSPQSSRPRLTAPMNSIAAARARLGVPSTTTPASHSLPQYQAGAGRGAGAPSVPATKADLRAERALAIAYDQQQGKLLYLMKWAPPFQNEPSWVYSNTLGGSDATVQEWIRKTAQGRMPIVFEKPFEGKDQSLDRRFPLPMQAVLQEVEDAADHQSPIGGLDEDVDEDDQGIVVGRQAATGDRRQQRASDSKAVNDSVPMDVLRRAQATAEAAAGAAMAVASAARQERVASAMRGLRQELGSDNNDEDDAGRGAGAGSGRSGTRAGAAGSSTFGRR